MTQGRTGGHPHHTGERGAAEENGGGPALGIRSDHAGRRHQARGQETGVGQRREHPGGQQHGEVGGERPDDMDGQEHAEERQQRLPPRTAPAEQCRQGRAHDHADGEGGREGARGGDGDPEVAGDVRHQAGQHELGGALGEDRQAEEIQSERHEDSTHRVADGGRARKGVRSRPARLRHTEGCGITRVARRGDGTGRRGCVPVRNPEDGGPVMA